MSINFDELPEEKTGGFTLPEPGNYKATIKKAEMRTPKNGGKDYLNLQLALENSGNIFDIITESPADLARYKLKRFLKALNLDFSGAAFELKDLVKLVVGKQFFVDVKIESSEQYGDKAIVDALTGEIYYPLEEVAEADIPFDTSKEENESESDEFL